VTLFGFIYDTIIWTTWGIYLVYILFIDLIDFAKTILYWIIHSILWFFRQYVPFLVFLYKVFIQYIICWPWWLYQIAYYNIRYAYNRNCYWVALSGTLQAGFIVFFFYFLEIILEDISGIVFIGFVLALLPLTWVFGEIASIRVQKIEDEPYSVVRSKFQNGIEAVRSILFYITLFVVLLFGQLSLNLLGWIPGSGILFAGFVFNLNTYINLVLLFLFIIIVLGVFVIPSYRLYAPFSEVSLSQTINLLKGICKKFLQYLFVTIPTSIFAIISMLIPVAIIAIVYVMTYNIKNSIEEVKINKLKVEQAISNNVVDAYLIGKHIEHLQYLQQFPAGLLQEMQHCKNLATEIIFCEEDVKAAEAEILLKTEDYKLKIINLENQINKLRNQNQADINITSLVKEKDQLQIQHSVYRSSQEISINKSKIDLEYLSLKKKQIPILFFLGGLWLVIFGGIVVSFAITYIGNVVHQVFVFRNDNESVEWKNIAARIRKKDPKQPLLGGTLIVLTLFLIYLLVVQVKFITTLESLLSALMKY
jgi:hypothetical protein